MLLEKATASCPKVQNVEVLAGYLQKTIKSFDINILNGIKRGEAEDDFAPLDYQSTGVRLEADYFIQRA